MIYLNNFEQHNINEESKFIKTIALSALLSLGLSKADAQLLSKKNDQVELSILDSLVSQNNKNPKSINDLERLLSTKVEDPKQFVIDNVKIEPDKTITVFPSFLKNLGLSVNHRQKLYSISYKIDFGK
jgi:hypothetical protein